ncbi:riboflavin synthase [Marivirga sp.]|uniref:riboflavin synthase n=1 Tax=Marivirga sp. TaxID=2018662 RepID=UPI0026000B78|nr:riboflavin synthase [Marivirga sp.]
MFTGIIESLGELKLAEKEGTNLKLTIKSDISNELKIDQSISHNGVCLTVTELHPNAHTVVAVNETLQKSSIGNLAVGDFVNLERCMIMNGRLDGHIVQGHVDAKGKCLDIKDEDGSWLFQFSYDSSENVLVEKGSICINGVSLTCFNVSDEKFSIAIIPYTFQHTNFKKMKKSDEVNLEFDIIGKYVHKLINKTN